MGSASQLPAQDTAFPDVCEMGIKKLKEGRCLGIGGLSLSLGTMEKSERTEVLSVRYDDPTHTVP